MRTALVAAAGSATGLCITQQLGAVQVTPLVGGRVAAGSAPVALSSLWKESGAVIFAVRRPG